MITDLSVGEEEETQTLADLISHAAEDFQLAAGWGLGGIVKSPMNRLRAWENRTLLLGSIADGDHVVELFIRIRRDILRSVL